MRTGLKKRMPMTKDKLRKIFRKHGQLLLKSAFQNYKNVWFLPFSSSYPFQKFPAIIVVIGGVQVTSLQQHVWFFGNKILRLAQDLHNAANGHDKAACTSTQPFISAKTSIEFNRERREGKRYL